MLVLGSAPLLMQRDLTESLAGRFEVLPVPHWSFADMQAAFGWDLDRYLFFGAYSDPGHGSSLTQLSSQQHSIEPPAERKLI